MQLYQYHTTVKWAKSSYQNLKNLRNDTARKFTPVKQLGQEKGKHLSNNVLEQ